MIWPPGKSADSDDGSRPGESRVRPGGGRTARRSIATAPQVFTVAQGHQLNLPVTITRRNTFAEAVALTAADLPANVVNGTATIAKTETQGTLPLFVAKTVAPGDYTFVVRGTGPFPFSKDPNAKTKPNITLNEPSNAIRLVVRPAPVTLTLNNKGARSSKGNSRGGRDDRPPRGICRRPVRDPRRPLP